MSGRRRRHGAPPTGNGTAAETPVTGTDTATETPTTGKETAVDGGALTNVLMISLVAVLAPLVADQLGRWLLFPTAVLEIGLGILVGPAVLRLVHVDGTVHGLATFALAMLFFLAGYELDLGRLRGPPVSRALLSWLLSLLGGVAVGALLAALVGGGAGTAAALGLLLATTALGMLLPVLRDAGQLDTSLGTNVLAVGAVGEFVPIVAVTLLFSGRRPVHATLLLLCFTVIAAGAVALASRRPPAPVPRLLTATLGTSAQFAVRLTLLVLVGMVWLALDLHLDIVLGAFAAGVVIRQVLTNISDHEAGVVESKLEGIGFGFLIPFFFVTTGMRIDVSTLLSSGTAIVLMALTVLALLVVRSVPVALLFRGRLPPRELRALGLYASTTLPMVVVVSRGALDHGWLDEASAAALVAAAMVSVLVYPLVALRVARSPDGDSGGDRSR